MDLKYFNIKGPGDVIGGIVNAITNLPDGVMNLEGLESFIDLKKDSWKYHRSEKQANVCLDATINDYRSFFPTIHDETDHLDSELERPLIITPNIPEIGKELFEKGIHFPEGATYTSKQVSDKEKTFVFCHNGFAYKFDLLSNGLNYENRSNIESELFEDIRNDIISHLIREPHPDVEGIYGALGFTDIYRTVGEVKISEKIPIRFRGVHKDNHNVFSKFIDASRTTPDGSLYVFPKFDVFSRAKEDGHVVYEIVTDAEFPDFLLDNLKKDGVDIEHKKIESNEERKKNIFSDDTIEKINEAKKDLVNLGALYF